ncbi:hypothetical protein KUL72_07770 [Bradyrhizobium arachidis]|uniref:hypothetical protein n=1 Tax=Bradyrhizobium TaxID=374 RepID=UPI00188DBC99|nr:MULTISPECIES: hypothetical protein [Bradyrhizobium]MDN4986410.1 hypothetical protein [Bradyrhizobium sp. WYCCWR 13022]UVO38253.1 hypothetical protein KUL72_07770 [Bradyrhizobium arachidis]
MKIVPCVGMIAAAIAVTTVATPSFAQGPGPCTSSGNMAVGAEGPAMSGGQLMAGVGNCRHRHARWRDSYGYYQAPARGYYDRGYYDRGYDGPDVTIGVGPGRW